MRFLLRSVLSGSPSDDTELAFRNYLLLESSGLGFEVPEDNTLWEFVRDFARTHNHVPDVRTLRSHFETLRQSEPVDRLETLVTLKPLYRGDFAKRLEEKAEERRTRLVLEMLREAGQITQLGLEIREGKEVRKLLGPYDAVRYLAGKSHDIVVPTTGTRLSGEVTLDGADFQGEYEKVKNDPLAGVGQYTGIEQMDLTLKGAKKFELWTHAAFTGGLKSTFGLNWAYNQAVYMRYDSCIFSLEMPYKQCRRLLYAMHSLHGKFRPIRIALGIQKSPGPNVGLDYGKIRDGELSPAEEEFLLQHVVPDFNSGLYGKIHIEVADPDKNDFTVLDLKSRAELIYARSPYSTLFVDHAGLMAPRKWVSSTTERLNEVMRDLKRLAMGFHRGDGMAVVTFFQISREGFKAAEKMAEKSNGTYATGGPYNLTHLSYANECVVGGTLCRTRGGLRRIDSIRPGEEVWSSTGWKEVRAFFDQGVKPTWRVTTSKGSEFNSTGDHRVRIFRGDTLAWERVENLRVGDILLGCETPLGAVFAHEVLVSEVCPTGLFERVYDLEVGGDHEYLTGPIYSHNCERSSDIVTTSFVDLNLRAQNRVLFQCLKSRDMAPFNNFFSRVEWGCRRILTSHEIPIQMPSHNGRGGSEDKNVKDTLDEMISLIK